MTRDHILSEHSALAREAAPAGWEATLDEFSTGCFTTLTRRRSRSRKGGGDPSLKSSSGGAELTNCTKNHSNTTPIYAGQTIRTDSGQNVLWEEGLAGPGENPPEPTPQSDFEGSSACVASADDDSAPDFATLPTVKAMGTGQARHVIGFDTEFTQSHDARVIDSYQFATLDPVDSEVLVEVVILPLEGTRILIEDALAVVCRAARLHLLADGMHPCGYTRREFWIAGAPYKEQMNALFELGKLPLVLAGHYLNADLSAFARPSGKNEKFFRHDAARDQRGRWVNEFATCKGCSRDWSWQRRPVVAHVCAGKGDDVPIVPQSQTVG